MIEVVRDPDAEAPAFPDAWLIEAAQAAFAAARVSPRPLTIRVASDATVKALNARFRGVDKPTDVLSFPMDEPDYLGDVALGFPFVAREAERLGVPLEAHLKHLVIHGVLHLLGYDHEADDDARRMQALEREAMQ
ncbi:MAG: rRNA maturation RNase YbeY, partial [Zetaproteobacteria bacterium]